MDAISEALRSDLRNPEFSEGYAESYLDSRIATQLRVLREGNHWTQADLAERIGTRQTVISRCEDVNYSSWNIRTLKKFARAFRLRLHVSFETYGSLIDDLNNFDRETLGRAPRERDPGLADYVPDSGAETIFGQALVSSPVTSGLIISSSVDVWRSAVKQTRLPSKHREHRHRQKPSRRPVGSATRCDASPVVSGGLLRITSIAA